MTKSQADSNLIATLNWEIPSMTFISIIESHEGRGEVELKGCLRSKEFVWYLFLLNDGYVRLTLDCTTPTDCSFPTLYYDLKFGGSNEKPYVCRKGPLFSLCNGPRQLYSYGSINILTLPVVVFQNDFWHFMPDDKLIISLKLYTFIGFDDVTDVHEIKVYLNPTNEALVNDFANLLKEPKYSDVTIICSGEALKAHKCILAARSSVFAEMFESVANEVTIVDVDVSVMKLVLQFIYTGEVDVSESNLMDVLHCAEKYDLNELKNFCLNKMCNLVVD